MAKEKPIIFSTEMVKAILDGRKTVTRRVIKPQPKYVEHIDEGFHYEWKHYQVDYESDLIEFAPYQKGSILWVKETWWDLGWMEKGKWNGRTQSHTIKPRYFASCIDPYAQPISGVTIPKPMPWKNSRLFSPTWRNQSALFMPKWAARIWLEVFNVRPERLQEITGADCVMEGCPILNTDDRYKAADMAYDWFIKLWDLLSTRRDFSLESNPWVWRYEFKRINR